MPFKLDASGNIATIDHEGRKLPVFVHGDGKEVPFDADSTLGTISRLNGEAKAHREAKEKAEGLLKQFEGITDPAAAIKALSVVQNLDAKKLVDAGEVEKVKAEAIKSVSAQFEPIVKERDLLRGELVNEKIGGSFARSKFIADKVAIPVDFVQATFGKHFTLDGGRIVARDASGTQIFSRSKHGEPADFEEALEILVSSHPQKAAILKGSNAAGGGSLPGSGGGGGGGGGKTISKQEFDGLGPRERAARMSEGFKVVE